VEHLIEHGINASDSWVKPHLYTINARFLGYRRALQDAGLKEVSFSAAALTKTLCVPSNATCGSGSAYGVLHVQHPGNALCS